MEKKIIDKKMHNICARFFGVEYVDDKDIQRFILKIRKVYEVELSKIDTIVKRIEKKVYKKGKHFNKDGIEVTRNYKHICSSKCEITQPLI